MQGLVRPAVGTEMGELLAALHARSAEQPDLANTFDNMDLLSALRLEPFFVAAMEANPEAAHRLREAVDHLRRYRTALIHGDFSPKNILIHLAAAGDRRRRMRLFGDPAFDLAFRAPTCS